MKNNLNRNFMQINFSFPGVRIVGDMVTPTTWKLSAKVAAIIETNDPSVSIEQVQERSSRAFQKIYFWFESYLPCVIVSSIDNEAGTALAAYSSNTMMHCPGEPTDDILVQLFHAKLSAIAGDDLNIDEVELEASDMSCSYVFSGPYFIPKTVKEFVDMPSLHRKPWWHRADGFAFEFLKPKDCKDKLSDIYADVIDPLESFEEQLEEATVPVEAATEIIKTEKWKPKTV
jgi:hypothetical protein